MAEPLNDEGGEETVVPGENPSRQTSGACCQMEPKCKAVSPMTGCPVDQEIQSDAYTPKCKAVSPMTGCPVDQEIQSDAYTPECKAVSPMTGCPVDQEIQSCVHTKV